MTPAEYGVGERERADALAARAEATLADSQDASTNATRFVTTALILALVLFFAGIATKFRDPRRQVALVALAAVTCVAGLSRVLSLPHLL